MCCEPSGYSEEEINGVCEKCGEPTINGDAFEKCYYSDVECEECGRAECDGNC